MLYVCETSPSKDLKYGHTLVGPTPVQITPNSVNLVRGLLLRAPGPSDLVPNTDVIYVGLRTVTATGAPGSALDGIPVLPGGAIELPVDDPSLIYAVSQTPDQDLCWMGV